MQKEGDNRDKDRRRDHVSELQDHSAWRKRRELPPPNATWSTCLIIAPSTVVHNWGREFETVCGLGYWQRTVWNNLYQYSGVISRLACIREIEKKENVL